MGRWVTSKGRRIYIPDEGEENPFAKESTSLGSKHDFQKVIRDAKTKEEVMNAVKEAGNAGLSKEAMDKVMEDAHDKAQELKKTTAGKGQGEISNQDFSSKGTYNFKGEKAPEDLPRVSDEEARHNTSVRFRGTDYQTQQLVDWDSEKKASYVAGHMYVPKDTLEKGSFFVAKDGSMWHSGSDYLIARSKAKYAKQADSDNNLKEKQVAANKAQAEKAGAKTSGKQTKTASGWNKQMTAKQLIEAYDKPGASYGDKELKWEIESRGYKYEDGKWKKKRGGGSGRKIWSMS